MPPTVPIAAPDAKACSSGVQPVNRNDDVTAAISVIFLKFFLIIILSPLLDRSIVYNKSVEIVRKFKNLRRKMYLTSLQFAVMSLVIF